MMFGLIVGAVCWKTRLVEATRGPHLHIEPLVDAISGQGTLGYTAVQSCFRSCGWGWEFSRMIFGVRVQVKDFVSNLHCLLVAATRLQ